MFESQLMQMPGPRDIVIYWPCPRAFSVVQKPRGWAHISVQKPRGARGGMVTGQIDTCIKKNVWKLLPSTIWPNQFGTQARSDIIVVEASIWIYIWIYPPPQIL